MNADFTELRSPRLTLRRLRAADAGSLCAYRGRPEVARYQSWETFTRAEAEQFIADQASTEPDTPGTWLQLAVVETASGALVGDCGLHFRADEPRQVEVGVTFDPVHQRRGLATEGLRCVLEYAFVARGKHRVSAVTDAENVAAAALFRRLGFRQEGHFVDHVWFKGAWGSELLFALLRREWEKRRNSVAE